MHIAFVTPESPYGTGCGVAAYLRAIIPAIVNAGHRVTVVSNAGEERQFATEGGRVTVCHFRLPSFHWQVAKIPGLRDLATLPVRQVEWSRGFYRRLARITTNTKIDVIESTETGSMFLHRLAPLVIRLHGSERIFREYSQIPLNPSVKWNHALESMACNRAAAITSPSEFHAKEMTRLHGWAAGRVRVIPNPVSQSLLDASLKFQRNGNNERIVLYAGRLAPVKGIETLLKAAKSVRAIDPSINFVLAGPWQMSDSPESYGLKNSENGIRWIGAQTQQQIIDWYKRASVLVLPSNYETFGLAAVEGVAFGLPVVATDVGALSEIASLSDKARLVSKCDPNALADGIVKAFSSQADKSERRNDGNGYRALDRYSPAVVAGATLKLYEEILNP
jgi:glycosyltransferase involved in cell wall biosynthesis